MYRGADDEFEPAWVSSERDQFRDFRDKNEDGYLDEDEVGSVKPLFFQHP